MNCSETTPISVVIRREEDFPQVEKNLNKIFKIAIKAIKFLCSYEHTSIKSLRELKEQFKTFYNHIFKLYKNIDANNTSSRCSNLCKVVTSVDMVLSIELPVVGNSEEDERAGEHINKIQDLVKSLDILIIKSDIKPLTTFLLNKDLGKMQSLLIDIKKYMKKHSF